ncbi:MAG: hypothetical protein FJX63_08590 [Alphaproteobacteria bacterium]|nr:hypothetical protein [Alphaproteobacteria bacterium]
MTFVSQTAPAPAGDSHRAGHALKSAVEAHEDPLLLPLVRLSLEPTRSGIGRGVIAAEIVLRNRSAVVAHRLFLCLPCIGLNLQPARGWKIEDMTSVRRLRRFQQFSGEALEPGADASCGNLYLPYRTGHGGFIDYAPGSSHALASLPDFRIGCSCGAGNFPAFRTELTIVADSLRQVIASHHQARQNPS